MNNSTHLAQATGASGNVSISRRLQCISWTLEGNSDKRGDAHLANTAGTFVRPASDDVAPVKSVRGRKKIAFAVHCLNALRLLKPPNKVFLLIAHH